MGKKIKSKCIKKNEKVCVAYAKMLLKELSDRGVDLPLIEDETYVDENGILINGIASSFEQGIFFDESDEKFEGLPLLMRSMQWASDKHKTIKFAKIIITTTFEYETGEEETYKLKDSDWSRLKLI